MSLARATRPDGQPLGLPGEPPFPADDLIELIGVPIDLPCEDPFVQGAGDAAHAYLDGARQAWVDAPEWMDFLDDDSPVSDLKRASRDLYLDVWRPHLPAEGRVLDVGCGIGRFTTWLLDQGFDVIGVDADLESLRRCLWHSAGRDGRLDLRWSSVHRLPDGPFDVAVAAEVLCYVPDVDSALEAIAARLKPGGVLLISVEGRHGWASAPDTPTDTLEQALTDVEVLDLPGERWVRLYDEADLRGALERAGLEVLEVLPTHYTIDGPLESAVPPSASLEELLEAEAACRTHPVWKPLNRVWTAVARKP